MIIVTEVLKEGMKGMEEKLIPEAMAIKLETIAFQKIEEVREISEVQEDLEVILEEDKRDKSNFEVKIEPVNTFEAPIKETSFEVKEEEESISLSDLKNKTNKFFKNLREPNKEGETSFLGFFFQISQVRHRELHR